MEDNFIDFSIVPYHSFFFHNGIFMISKAALGERLGKSMSLSIVCVLHMMPNTSYT